MRKKIMCLMLALVTVLALLPITALAQQYTYRMSVSVEAPAVGAKPADAGKSRNAGGTKSAVSLAWSGELDANGCFKEGVAYAFAVPGGWEVTAKVSPWAVNEVSWAAVSNLIDQSLLGGDYTVTINRLQFCSVSVRMAERLLGKEISPAASGTFTDTDDVYVRKAVTAGISKSSTSTPRSASPVGLWGSGT